MQYSVGSKIKNKRKEQHLTLKDLSEKTGLSAGYLSLLERGLNSPTISNLHKICSAINTTLIELLSDLEEQHNLVRKGERNVYFSEEGKLIYENLIDGDRSLVGTCLTILDNDYHDAGTHLKDEFGVIVSGGLKFTLMGETFEMYEGDSVFIPSGTNHGYQKIGTEKCTSYWISPSTNGESIIK